MGVADIASNTLIRAKKSALKRGKTYIYDAMNLLYSMCCISAISDLLGQNPPVPTRSIVSQCLSVMLLSSWLNFAVFFLQVFAFLDKWCQTHGFDATEAGDESIYLIFVLDGRIDQCKIGRNAAHDSKKAEFLELRERLSRAKKCSQTELQKYVHYILLGAHIRSLRYTFTHTGSGNSNGGPWDPTVSSFPIWPRG